MKAHDSSITLTHMTAWKLFIRIEHLWHAGVVTVAGDLQDQATIPCGDTVTLAIDVTDGCNTAQDTLVVTVDKGRLFFIILCSNTFGHLTYYLDIFHIHE
jgi:hypothetical protein